MVYTRNGSRVTGEGSNGEERIDGAHPHSDSGNGPPPLPENPTLAQVMAHQTQMMAAMMQQMQQQHQQMHQRMLQHAEQQHQQFGPPPPQSKLPEFLRVRPPTFSSTTNPMEANDWLHAIEKKLNLLQCNDQEKVAFATHQLQGPASAWWDNHMATRPPGTEVTWAEFCHNFRKAQVPDGVVAQKKREFRALHQGNRTVTEYLHEFNRLARYAPEDVHTDAEKQEKFMAGLDDELTNQLISGDYTDFERLVDKAIRQEDQRNKMDRKRKAAQFRAPQGSHQRPRFTPGQQGGPTTMIVRQYRPFNPSNFPRAPVAVRTTREVSPTAVQLRAHQWHQHSQPYQPKPRRRLEQSQGPTSTVASMATLLTNARSQGVSGQGLPKLVSTTRPQKRRRQHQRSY
jgi:Retrotransposon gag protein.